MTVETGFVALTASVTATALFTIIRNVRSYAAVAILTDQLYTSGTDGLSGSSAID